MCGNNGHKCVMRDLRVTHQEGRIREKDVCRRKWESVMRAEISRVVRMGVR